jgi:hypothetical protein
MTLGSDVTKDKATYGFVVTRLHARYDKSSLGEDLVFKAAEPIAGGREFLTDGKKLETGAVKFSVNNFQGRYAIRYPWTGEVKCKAPMYNRWGGPPNEQKPPPTAAANNAQVKRDPEAVSKFAESAITEFDIKGLKPQAGVALKKK